MKIGIGMKNADKEDVHRNLALSFQMVEINALCSLALNLYRLF